MNIEIEKIIVDILAQEMGLVKDGKDPQIWIENQNKIIPNDNGFYVTVAFENADVVANNNRFDDDGDVIKEIQSVLQHESIQINIFSRSSEARRRRAEVLMALASIYSVQKQEENDFKIYKVPSVFVNASEAEGGSQLHRYMISVICGVWYRKEQTPLEGKDHFENFGTRVDNEESITEDNGIIELNIP